jgi:8-oxo-dGTP pyrophosphatase MutT (NUDIX family)
MTQSAGILFTHKGRCLLAHSTNARTLSSWMPPKGHLEDGETHEQAALREVQEEIGWKLKTPLSGHYFDVPYTDRKGVVYKTVRVFTHELESENPEECKSIEVVGGLQKDEVDQIRWFNFIEIKHYALPRYVNLILNHI